MKRHMLWLVAGLLALGGAQAGPYSWTIDPYNDASGGNDWEIHQLGWRIEGDNLEVLIRTNIPQAPRNGADSYSSNTPLSAGDLYINVGGSYTAGTGSSYGLAFTTHSGDMTADPNDNGLPWSPVTAGYLYGNAIFATGTAESYVSGPSASPWDGGNDPYGHANNLPALIAGYGSNLGYQGPVTWTNVGSGNPWKYEVSSTISLASLGLTYDSTFELWWSMECGNDGIKATGSVPPVPEPASLAFLLLGGLGLVRRRRSVV